MKHPIPTYGQLFDSLAHSPTEFFQRYAQSFDAIRGEVRGFTGLHHGLVSVGHVSPSTVRAGMVLSDLFSLALTKRGEVGIYRREGFRPLAKAEVRDAGRALVQYHRIHDGFVTGAAFVVRLDDRMRWIMRYLAPAVQAGRLMVVPHCCLTLQSGENMNAGSERFNFAGVEEFSTDDDWISQAKQTRRPSISATSRRLVLPFVTEIPLRRFLRIMDEEHDCIANLRVAIKTVSSGINPAVDINEMVADLVQPRLDDISRRLRAHVRTRRPGVAGGVIAVAGLTAMAFTHEPSVPLAVAIGSAGIGALQMIGTLREGTEQFREDPWFLLWKLDRARP